MFKNEVKSLRRRSAAYDAHLSRLAQALLERDRGGDAPLTALLWGGPGPEPYAPGHKPGNSHDRCSRDESDPPKPVERQLCRCMLFYGRDPAKCRTCSYPTKWKNATPAFHLTDYEHPTPYREKGLGEIDLLWTWKGTDYAVEVKPPNSRETILRMAAEILTYTWHDHRYAPAICFFKYKWEQDKATGQYRSTKELSEQAKEYYVRRNDDNFQTLLRAVRLFYITLDHDAFSLHDNGEKPL